MRAWRLPRVTMLIQYLYRDEPELSRFQTGLVFAGLPLEALAAGDTGCRSRRWDKAGSGRSSGVRSARDAARAEALPAGDPAQERVEAGRARPADERKRRLHAHDSRQARRALRDPVAEPATLQSAAADQVSVNVSRCPVRSAHAHPHHRCRRHLPRALGAGGGGRLPPRRPEHLREGGVGDHDARTPVRRACSIYMMMRPSDAQIAQRTQAVSNCSTSGADFIR